MQIWLDTIDLKTIEIASKYSFFYGITTNPSILSKCKDVNITLQKLLSLQKGPVAVQVTEEQAQGMVKEAKQLTGFSKRIIVKVPVNKEGLQAISILTGMNIPTLGTCIFEPINALLAALSGAKYIAPYVDHMAKNGDDYLDVLKTILSIYKNHNLPTKVLAASVKTKDQFIQCARLGIEAVTIKEDFIYEIFQEHPLVTKNLQHFSKAWNEEFQNRSLCELFNTTFPAIAPKTISTATEKIIQGKTKGFST